MAQVGRALPIPEDATENSINLTNVGTNGVNDAVTNYVVTKGHVEVVARLEISASADGGPRSRVRARGTLRSAPHRH